ncbi:hypothetical protein [Qipengyuania flava]|uniref:hypothetical protein n=1 Tax=Qipengyuania flava TaxID=192812 RepID=UPI003BB21973
MTELGGLAPHWVGHIFGTNTGRLHLAIETAVEGVDHRLGLLRLSDDNFGTSNFKVQVTLENKNLTLTGEPLGETDGVEQGGIRASAKFDAQGNLHGEWSSTNGTGGAFDLYPHLGTALIRNAPKLEQIYTSTRELGALRLFKSDIEEILAIMRRKFPGARVVVTHLDRGAELARYDDEFQRRFKNLEKLDWIKLSVQSAAEGGFVRSLTLDLGQEFNRVTTQGPDEAWVLGEVEATALALRRRQHGLSTAIGKYKVSFNQFIFLAALVAMPELPLKERVIFVSGVILLLVGANKAANLLVPNFIVDFQTDRPNWLAGIWPSAVSWLISVTSAVAASFLFDWLRG